MATTPDAGVDLSDDDLDDLIAEASGEDTTSTTDPEPESPAPPADEAADTPTETPEPDTSLASTVADEGTPETDGQPAADEELETPAEPAAPAPPDLSAGKPFQFKASGGEHILPGALELPDGSVVIPKDSQPDLRQRLASQVELSRELKTVKREFDRKLTQAREQRTAKDVEADYLVQLFDSVLKMTPDERFEWAEKLDQDRPKIELDIQRKQLEAEREQLKRERQGPEPTPEERQEQQVGEVIPHLNAVFTQIMATPEAKALTKDEATLIYNKYAKNPRRLLSLVRVATEDYPAEGIMKGQRYLDPEDIRDDFDTAIRLKPKTPTPAATRNAALNADKAPAARAATPIPPTVRGGGKVAGTPGKKKPVKFDRDAFMKGELDDDI